MKNIKSQNVIAFLFLIALALSMAGCSTAKVVNPNEGKIYVNVTKVENHFIEVPETVLNKCQKPAKLSKLFEDITNGKVREKDLVVALIGSYTNEVNCWMSKEEAIVLQRDLKETVKASEAKATGK